MVEEEISIAGLARAFLATAVFLSLSASFIEFLSGDIGG